jgi:hypothetical protein
MVSLIIGEPHQNGEPVEWLKHTLIQGILPYTRVHGVWQNSGAPSWAFSSSMARSAIDDENKLSFPCEGGLIMLK